MRLDPPEPKGKLDAMLTDTTVDAVTVNGPEGVLPAWDAIDWRTCEEEVRRLRQRIFKAVQEQDWPKVRNLQKLMLRSRSNTLVSVLQGNAAQCWAQDRGNRRGGRADLRGKRRSGGAGALVCVVLDARRGQARVYPEGIKPCEAQAARNPGDHGPLPSGQGPQHAGTRVGCPVRAPQLRVPAGPWLP
jgi:hypothetical protein